MQFREREGVRVCVGGVGGWTVGREVPIKQLGKIVVLISTQAVSSLVHCKMTQWAFESCLMISRYLLRGVRAALLCGMKNARNTVGNCK